MRDDTRERLSALLKQAFDDAHRFADGLAQIALDELEAQIAECDQKAQPEPKQTPDEMESLLTVEEAAALLKVEDATLYAWVSQGKIPHRKVRSLVRFHRGELLEWTAAQAQESQQVKQARRAKPARNLRMVK